MIYRRRRTFFLLLKDECHTEQEMEFVKEWFRTIYIKAEDRACQAWIKALHRFALLFEDNRVRVEETKELINFDEFLKRMWYKYHYNVMRLISKKFRPR